MGYCQYKQHEVESHIYHRMGFDCCFECSQILYQIEHELPITQTHCYDCGRSKFINEVEMSRKNDEDMTTVPRCKDCVYRKQKRWRHDQGEAKIMWLYDTEQFLIDFEVYNRGMRATYVNFDDPQDPGRLRFKYEDKEYILFELALHNNDPDAEEGSDCYWTEPCCNMSENVEVDLYDFEWTLNYWYHDAVAHDVENGLDNSYNKTMALNLPFDHPLPQKILELAREKWPLLDEHDQKFIDKHRTRLAFLSVECREKE